MKKKSYQILLCLISLSAVLLMARPGNATLGQPEGSIESDRKALSGMHRMSTSQNGYTIQEIDCGGTAVREYLSSSGVVFAVAWNGLRHPDLTTLLGSYASAYEEALQNTARKPGVRRLAIETDGLVVQKWGHVGSLAGRAYAPDLIPSGVTIDEIK